MCMKMNTTVITSAEGWYLHVSPPYVISLHVFHFLVGLPLNTYAIILLSSGNGVMEAAEVFTLNQAVAEITFVFLGPFHSLCSVGPQLCFYKLVGFMFGISMCSRALFQCFVCLERYVAVVYPVMFLRLKPIRYRIECCVFGWTFSLGFAITCLLTFPNMPYNIYAALYIIALSLNMFSCVSILKKLRHPGPGDRGRGEREMNSFKKKAFQVVCMNLFVFLTHIIPMTISFGLREKLSMREFSLAAIISLVISITVGFVQPIFVLHRAGKLSTLRDVWTAKIRRPCMSWCRKMAACSLN